MREATFFNTTKLYWYVCRNVSSNLSTSCVLNHSVRLASRHTYQYNFDTLKKIASRRMTSKELRDTIPNKHSRNSAVQIYSAEGRRLSFTFMPTVGVIDYEN